MIKTLLVGGLLASAIIAPALSQSATTTSPAPSASVTTSSQSDMWRASKLVGLNVYNDKNEKLGDISELLLDKSGKVAGVVIGVGGFLGMGQHDIMVEMSKLKFADEPMRTSSTSTSSTSTTGAPTSTTTTNTTRDKWYPDHAVLSGATKDSLKAMTQFQYK